MAQFDVWRLADGMPVVDLQTDLIGLDASRIVAPLRAEGAYARFPGLNRTRRRRLIRQGPRSRWRLIRTPGESFGRQARRRGTANVDPA